MREFKGQKLLGRLNGVNTAEPNFCFHTVPYSSNLFHIYGEHCVSTVLKNLGRCSSTVAISLSYVQHALFLVRSMWTVPKPPGVIPSRHKCLSNSKTEQVVILTLRGKDMSQGLSLLHRALTEGPEGG